MNIEFSTDICELLSNVKHSPDMPVREHKKAVGKNSTFCAQLISKKNLLNVAYVGAIDLGWINHVLGHCHRSRKNIRLFVGVDPAASKSVALLDNLMLLAKDMELTSKFAVNFAVVSTTSLVEHVEKLGLALDLVFMAGLTHYSEVANLLDMIENSTMERKPVYSGDNFFIGDIRRAINDHCLTRSRICISPGREGSIFISAIEERAHDINKLFSFPVFALSKGPSTEYAPLKVMGWEELQADPGGDHGMTECKLLIQEAVAIPAVNPEMIYSERIQESEPKTWINKVTTTCGSVSGGIFKNGYIARTDQLFALADQSILKAAVGMAKPYERTPILSLYKSDLQMVNGTTLLLTGPGQNNFYHWLIDILPKLFVADKLLENDPDFKIGYAGLGFQKESLDILGVPKDKLLPLELKRGYRFERSVFIDRLSGNSWQLHPALGDFLRGFGEKALAKVKAKSSEKRRRIYIDRRGAKRRKMLNEEDLIMALKALDFEIVQLEKLSMPEQVALFQNVSTVVAPHGAGLTNLVFCTGEVFVVEIFCDIYLNSCFWYLSAMAKAAFKWRCMVFPGENTSEEKHDLNFNVDVPLVLKAIIDA